MQNREDIYTKVTNQIIEAIEAGAKKCRLPWHITEADFFEPVNAVSKRPYRGVNVVILWSAAISKGYASGLWATYEQWKQLGAQVRKGEKSTLVVLWKPTESDVEDDDGKKKTRKGLIARGFWVFNAAQVDGYQPVRTPKPFVHVRIRSAENVLLGAGADIRHGGATAAYDRDNDFVRIPRPESFRDATGYYAVLAHELVHWTATPQRLNRDLSGRFGSVAYAAEELVAELGAAFLCASLGVSVEPREDHAGYIANWLHILKNDKKAIFTAAAKAQQAANWIHAQSSETVDLPEEPVAG